MVHRNQLHCLPASPVWVRVKPVRNKLLIYLARQQQGTAKGWMVGGIRKELGFQAHAFTGLKVAIQVIAAIKNQRWVTGGDFHCSSTLWVIQDGSCVQRFVQEITFIIARHRQLALVAANLAESSKIVRCIFYTFGLSGGNIIFIGL